MENEPQMVYLAELRFRRSIGGVFGTKEDADDFCDESRKVDGRCDFVTREYVLDAKAGWNATQYWGYSRRIEREPAIEDVGSYYTDNVTAERIKNCTWDAVGDIVEAYSLVSAEDCLQKAIRLRNSVVEANGAKA